MRDASAWGAWKNANDRLNSGKELSEQEKNYLAGVKKNAVASGIMSAAQGVNGILNPALQAAQIGDTSMYQYDIANVAELGTGPYYDWDQLGGDYANANLNMKPIEVDDVRGMSTKEKWGAGVTGALAGAQAGMAIGGPWGALAGGVLGAGAAAIGITSGNRKARREAMSLNNQADIAQQYAKQNFGAAFERVADRQNRIGQSNIAAKGGKITQAAKSKHMTIQQFANSVLAKQKADKYSIAMDKHRFSAGGKTYNVHGGYYSPDIIKIEAGGTHEQNPFGGIQLGMDQMGVPNLVEEGEVIYDDYVFSDRLNASESLLKEYALPTRYAGKSFAYIADKLSSEAKERPNDSISNSGLGAMYDRLMAAQDAYKAKLEENKLRRELKKLSPEELMAIQQAMAMQAIPPEEQMMQQQPDIAPIGAMPMVGAYGGRLTNKFYKGGYYNLHSFLNPHNEFLPSNSVELLPYTRGLTADDVRKMEAEDYYKNFTDFVYNNWNDEDVQAYLRNLDAITGKSNIDKGRDFFRRMREDGKYGYYHLTPDLEEYEELAPAIVYGERDTHGLTIPPARSLADLNTSEFSVGKGLNATPRYWFQREPSLGKNYSFIPDAGPVNADAPTDANPTKGNNNTKVADVESNMPMLPTWQRYAGAGYNFLTGLYNAFQGPDRYQYRRWNPSYTYGDLTLDRLEYNPYDYNLAINQLNASNAATMSQIANSGVGPSVTTALLAQNYNAGRNLGNAYWQTRLANQQQKANVIGVNNQAAQAEADYDYRRDVGNTNIRNQSGLYNLQNAIQTDYLNKQADAQYAQAVSQPFDAFALDVTRIGEQNFNTNRANSDKGLLYYTNPWSGETGYKNWDPYVSSMVAENERLRNKIKELEG